MATQLLAFLPAAVQATIQDGILERKMYDAMKPLLLWRGLCEQEKHPGGVGERIIKTRSGLIVPDTEATAKRTPGVDPGLVTRSVEQFSYQVAPYGKSLDIHLPASWLAQYSRFLDDTQALGFHAAQTMGRICRNRLLAAYGGGNSFAMTGATSTALVVKDATGFDTVMVNGVPIAVSVSNPLPITIAGVAKSVTACDLTTNTLTLSVSSTWSQYDAVVRVDAAIVVRQADRATDRLIVAGDVATAKTFRNAAALMRIANVPALDGSRDGLYGCFVDPQTETALLTDAEFHDAIQREGVTDPNSPFASGKIGVYGGIMFIRNTEMTKLAADSEYQTTIHRSIMFGAQPLIEAYIPEAEFAMAVPQGGIAGSNHFKMPLDDKGVLTLVLRAPMDRAGEVLSTSWLGNVDYAVPSDVFNQAGAARFKRCAVIHTAGPA
jgi:hypothetical protein